MTVSLAFLIGTAATMGFLHTLAGPDHYLPFVVLARARKWSLPRTVTVTVLCGIGHIASSVALGLIGIAAGVALGNSETLEALYDELPGWMHTAEGARGDIAAWLLIIFGLLYFAWGLRRSFRDRSHAHRHVHLEACDGDGQFAHEHEHTHDCAHVHVHDAPGRRLTPWVLFIIFVFGPCEPLIPMVIAAAVLGPWSVAAVSGVFGGITVLTMLGAVLLGTFGLKLLPTRWLERHSHALAGATICFCGVAIVFLGL